MSVSVYIPISSRIPFVLQLIIMDLRGVCVHMRVHACVHAFVWVYLCIDMRVPQHMWSEDSIWELILSYLDEAESLLILLPCILLSLPPCSPKEFWDYRCIPLHYMGSTGFGSKSGQWACITSTFTCSTISPALAFPWWLECCSFLHILTGHVSSEISVQISYPFLNQIIWDFYW